jgi:hypothetical protein
MKYSLCLKGDYTVVKPDGSEVPIRFTPTTLTDFGWTEWSYVPKYDGQYYYKTVDGNRRVFAKYACAYNSEEDFNKKREPIGCVVKGKDGTLFLCENKVDDQENTVTDIHGYTVTDKKGRELFKINI